MGVSDVEVVYYAACSVDGYLATEDGGVDWLAPFQGDGEDYGYAQFYSSVQALLMGSRTYEVALTQGSWPSPDKPSWVFTRRELPVAHPTITLTSSDPSQVVELLRARGFRRAWLMGGGELAAAFRTRGMISHYMIFVVPVVLGCGIPLFATASGGDSLRLIESKTYSNGVVELDYERRSDP